MGFFDNAMNSMESAFDKGVNVAKGAVSGIAIEQQPFMRAFARLCEDGWLQGWHERNGGNLSYRMKPEEVSSCRSYFLETPRPWVNLGVQCAMMGGSFFAVTGSGLYLRNVKGAIEENVGIVEISAAGNAYRVVWGLKNGDNPSSELANHILCNAARMSNGNPDNRVVYHAHPVNIVAMSFVVKPDARELTRKLWQASTESVIAFPRGVGAVPCVAPGSTQLAEATFEAMRTFEVVVYAQHGVIAAGSTFDAAFGTVHAVEKAAEIYCKVRAMTGEPELPGAIDDATLRSIGVRYNMPVNTDFLD